MKHIAIVNNRKLELISKEVFLADIAQHEGHTVEIIVKRHRNGRSLAQNAYYHVVVECIRQAMEEAGNEYTHDQTHDILREEFLSERTMVANKHGEYLETTIVKSTTQLNTKEFSEYLDKVIRWASEFFCITIPSPENYERN